MDACEEECEARDDGPTAREIRARRVAGGEVVPWLVYALGTERCYGGPEEGGWWYDAQRLLEVRKVWSVPQALRAVRALREAYPAPRYNRHSVLGGEDIVIGQAYDADDLPDETPRGRPRYE